MLFIAPTVSALDLQPIAITETSRPFISSLVDLPAVGYVEDEYQASGTANIYEYDDQLDVQILSTDVPYSTRILVRRPESPEDFNGVIVFEMLNPTAGYDLDFMWQYTHPLITGDGYIWVGMTIRENALGVLQGWDPDRYGSLSLVDRGLSYDAFGDIGGLLRDSSDPGNPLADYNVTTIVGAGYSQSGDWLTTFSNEFHDTTVNADGTPTFDGYLGAGGNASSRGLNSADPGSDGNGLHTDERRYNIVDAPYFRVQSESEIAIFSYPANLTRQPDTDVFRQWEVAGTTHADGSVWQPISEMQVRDLGFPLNDCNFPQSTVAQAPYIRSALHHLTMWVTDGTPPPASQAIALNAQWDVQQDEFGNALGGLRDPALQVPIATYIPYNLPGLCGFTGTIVEFSPEEIERLYPQHGKFVSRASQSVNDLRKRGYLLPEDAESMKNAAAASEVGK